jgi:hypothetical protein
MALKIPGAPPFLPLLPQSLAATDISIVSIAGFSQDATESNHTVALSDWLLSLNNMHLYFLQVFFFF